MTVLPRLMSAHGHAREDGFQPVGDHLDLAAEQAGQGHGVGTGNDGITSGDVPRDPEDVGAQCALMRIRSPGYSTSSRIS